MAFYETLDLIRDYRASPSRGPPDHPGRRRYPFSERRPCASSWTLYVCLRPVRYYQAPQAR
ncbi:hypothetical protein M8494_13825 [Serratia ureilytica]